MSNGEYSISTDAPRPLASPSVSLLPGTLIISPNVHTVLPGTSDSSIALSMYEVGVTHTGHPGPDSSLILSDSISGIPLLEIAPVWLPHTSIIVIAGPSYFFKNSIIFFNSSDAINKHPHSLKYHLDQSFPEFLFLKPLE